MITFKDNKVEPKNFKVGKAYRIDKERIFIVTNHVEGHGCYGLDIFDDGAAESNCYYYGKGNSYQEVDILSVDVVCSAS